MNRQKNAVCFSTETNGVFLKNYKLRSYEENFFEFLLNNFVSASRACESIWLCLEYETHTQNIAHCLAQSHV